MSHELHLRQRAIRLKLAGVSISTICHDLQRSRAWFYRWWRRYTQGGPPALHDHSRAPKTRPSALSDQMRQAILSIRDRLMRRQGPHARYRLAGAPTIRYELECLGYTDLPSLRTIERVLHAAQRTKQPFRPQGRVASHDYPGVRATHSNHVHQLDLIGPRYLKGSRRQWFFLVYQDSYDQAVYVEFQPKPKLESVLAFVVRAWQRMGLPEIVQVDNGELFGHTSHRGSLNRFIRLALLVGVELTFIPEREPWRNGSIERFNGWLQERLLAVQLHSAAQVRGELEAMMRSCFQEQIHPQLDFQTAAEVRRTLKVRSLPDNFAAHQQALPVSIGRVSFIRRVRRQGEVSVLGVKVRVGKRLAQQYVRVRLYTRTMTLKVYHQRQVVKQLAFPFVGKLRL